MADINLGGVVLAQALMLALYYGAGWLMPWWVLWFPTLFVAGLLAALLLFLLVVAVVSAW